MKNNIFGILLLAAALGLANGAWAADSTYMTLKGSAEGKALSGGNKMGLAIESITVSDRNPSRDQKAHPGFTVTLAADKTATVFRNLNVESKVIPEVLVTRYRSAGGASKVFCTYHFKNAVVANTRMAGRTMTVQFYCETMTYQENSPAGSSVNTVRP